MQFRVSSSSPHLICDFDKTKVERTKRISAVVSMDFWESTCTGGHEVGRSDGAWGS